MLVAFATPALACSSIGSMQPFAEQLTQADPAFIGQVVAVDPGKSATFKVINDLHGDTPRDEQVQIKTDDTSCTHRFGVGESWVYAGSDISSPSLLMTNGIHFSRIDDTQLGLPKDWQHCARNSDCVKVSFACSNTAVATGHEQDANAFILKTPQSPAKVECASNRTPPFETAQCDAAGQCGWFQLIRPDPAP